MGETWIYIPWDQVQSPLNYMGLPSVSDTGQTVVLHNIPKLQFVLATLSFKIQIFPASIHALVWKRILETQSEVI